MSYAGAYIYKEIEEFDLNNVDTLIGQYQLDKNNTVSIIAGHYCISEELIDLSNEAESEVNSFEFGASLYSSLHNKGKNPKLILFINDIGVDKEQRKKIVDNYRIPQNYIDILNRHEISYDAVKIVFESSIRNRASKEIRKLKKNDNNIFEIIPSTDKRLVRCVDPAAFCDIPSEQKDAITIKGPEGEYLVVKEGSNPKCNTILATLFNNLEREHKCETIVNCFNVIYVNRIKLGEYVSDKLFQINLKKSIYSSMKVEL